MTILETIARDVRYAARMLRRSPAFAVTAAITLAIGIGVNTTVFTIVDAVLLKPLPYPAPSRLALVSRTVRQAGAEDTSTAVDGRTREAIRDGARTVDSAVFSDWARGVNVNAPGVGGAATARYVQQQRVGAGFFRVLGVPPLLGREFTPDEDRPGGPSATVLSARLWHTLFDSDPNIVGRWIVLRGEPHAVVGVMPDGFQSDTRADLWTPLRASTTGEGGGENYHTVVRLRDRSSWPQAAAEIARIGQELTRERPAPSDVKIDFSIVSLQEGLTSDIRQPLLMLWAAVGVVLLVAAINVAGLLLARASQRAPEIATRMALGSGRSAVVRQLFVEGLVLVAIGGAAGVAVGFVSLEAIRRLSQNAFEIWQPVSLDVRAVGAAMALSLIAAALFSVTPAVHASRVDVHAGLRESGARSIAGGRARWLRRLLVMTQVALGVVLLVSAGLLVRTFQHLRGLDPGFDPTGVLTASISLEDARYRSADRVVHLFETSLDRMRMTPGVEAAAVVLGLPYQRILNIGFRRLDGPAAAENRGAMTSATYVTADYFKVMRIGVRQGRTFDARDIASAPPVVVVNERFARMYFNPEDPIGRRVRFAGRDREIVGIVADVQLKPGWGDNGPLAPMPLAYLPVAQVTDGFLRLVHGWFSPTFVMRSSLPPASAAAAMRRAVEEVDPLMPFAEMRAVTDVQQAAIAPQRFLMALVMGLAAAAVAMAAVGLHGLVATSVVERTREIGIRLALGATPPQAMRTLATPGIALAAVGIAVGLMLAGAAGRLLRHFIWGVSENDPATFVAVAVMLLTIAAVASVTPALRILRLDPAATLRRE